MTDSLTSQAHTTRHETFALYRAVAIVGQLCALTMAWSLFGLELNYLAALAIISFWIALNMVQMMLLGKGYRLSSGQAFILLTLDLLEFSALLFVTGGVQNPFAILMIVPAVLGANAVTSGAATLLALFTIFAITLNYYFASPIGQAGKLLEVPQLLTLGNALSILISMVFLGFFARRIAGENMIMTKALAASELALQREHRLTSLGGLVAAYAHELGTPLASIRLIASEVLSEKLKNSTREDLEQIQTQAQKCAQILSDMGRIGKDDAMVKTLPLEALIEEAAAPHMARGKKVRITQKFDDHDRILMVNKSSAVIHSLRNIIQNAVDFALTRVEIEVSMTKSLVSIRVIDDGLGYPSDVLNRIGEPYIKSRQTAERDAYAGMGLGLFISKTLIESTGAKILFANLPKSMGSGAVVSVTWPRHLMEISLNDTRTAMGKNLEHLN